MPRCLFRCFMFWKERQKSIIVHKDVRNAVVAESESEAQAAAAFVGALADASSRAQSGIWEAHKVQSTIQFFVKVKVGTSTCVVKGDVEEVLGGVIGGCTLSACRITCDYTLECGVGPVKMRHGKGRVRAKGKVRARKDRLDRNHRHLPVMCRPR